MRGGRGGRQEAGGAGRRLRVCLIGCWGGARWWVPGAAPQVRRVGEVLEGRLRSVVCPPRAAGAEEAEEGAASLCPDSTGLASTPPESRRHPRVRIPESIPKAPRMEEVPEDPALPRMEFEDEEEKRLGWWKDGSDAA